MPSREESVAINRSSQTLVRGLDILDVAREGPVSLTLIMDRLGLTRSTAHRLASALVERGYLGQDGRTGYRLGPRLVSLAFRAGEGVSLPDLARPVLADLSQETEDATNLAIRAGEEIIYLAQAPGRRRLAVRHQVGDRNLIADTALGRALLADADACEWGRYFRDEARPGEALLDTVFHLDDGGDRICCIASPIRDATGAVVAALSLSSIPRYMDRIRMLAVAPRVRAAADRISTMLGFEVRQARSSRD